MINPPKPTLTSIHVTCNKCRREAGIILPAKRNEIQINWYAVNVVRKDGI
jgi:hypothetical protein